MTLGSLAGVSGGVGKSTCAAARTGVEGTGVAGATSLSWRGAKAGAAGVLSGDGVGVAAGVGSGTARVSETSEISSITSVAGAWLLLVGASWAQTKENPASKADVPRRMLRGRNLRRRMLLGRTEDTDAREAG